MNIIPSIRWQTCAQRHWWICFHAFLLVYDVNAWISSILRHSWMQTNRVAVDICVFQDDRQSQKFIVWEIDGCDFCGAWEMASFQPFISTALLNRPLCWYQLGKQLEHHQSNTCCFWINASIVNLTSLTIVNFMSTISCIYLAAVVEPFQKELTVSQVP